MQRVRHWSTRHARGLYSVYRLFARCSTWLRPVVRFTGRQRAEALLGPVERTAKQLFFDCHMCGQCVLSETGMACPMNCAKQMRNGPCGGVRPDGRCEVKPEMACVWIEAQQGQQRIGGTQPGPLSVLPPLDHLRQGRSTWLQVVDSSHTPPPFPSVAEFQPQTNPHPGRLETACRSGRTVVTVEIAPPDSADARVLLDRARLFAPLVDGMNITDGAGGNCHMSSVAASAILAEHGLTPIYQVTCRDRNRIALQGDILGAAALGVENVLCLTGDDVSQGDHPQAKPVFDLDSVGLLSTIRCMRDRGEFISGRRLETPPRMFIGATANPFVPPFADRIVNLEKKIAAGAQFIQTQFCFDVPVLERFMAEVRARGLHERASFLIGVGTLSSAKALRWMANHVPGVAIPETVLRRIAQADDQKAAAKQICIETIQQVVTVDGVRGVHLMGHRNEEVLVEIIEQSGVRSRSDQPLTQ